MISVYHTEHCVICLSPLFMCFGKTNIYYSTCHANKAMCVCSLYCRCLVCLRREEVNIQLRQNNNQDVLLVHKLSLDITADRTLTHYCALLCITVYYCQCTGCYIITIFLSFFNPSNSKFESITTVIQYQSNSLSLQNRGCKRRYFMNVMLVMSPVKPPNVP